MKSVAVSFESVSSLSSTLQKLISDHMELRVHQLLKVGTDQLTAEDIATLEADMAMTASKFPITSKFNKTGIMRALNYRSDEEGSVSIMQAVNTLWQDFGARNEKGVESDKSEGSEKVPE